MTNKTVIVGISGGIRSLIAAYILKRQKYNVVGVSVLFSDAPDVHLNHNQNKLQSFFKTIQIPYYQIQEYERYHSHVIDFIISSRISGHLFCAKTALSNLLLDALTSQMTRFQADVIATGHWLRLAKNHQTHSSEIYQDKNTTNDQSHLLAFAPPEQLSRLELPLTGMQPNDIKKIANILNITLSPKKSFLQHTYENLTPLMEKKIPPEMRLQGDIIQHSNQYPVGNHKGIHHFSLGAPVSSQEISLNDSSLKIEQMIPVKIIWQRNQVVIMDKNKWIPCTHVVLSHCQYFFRIEHKFPSTDNLTIRINATDPHPLQIRHLNNHNVLCILKKPCPHPIFPQMSAVIYDAEKVILGGKIFQAGHLQQGAEPQLQLLPPAQKEADNPSSQDISHFKF